jgi:hypothetical protein
MTPEEIGVYAVETVTLDQREPTGRGAARIIAHQVEDAIREAVAAERERCAQLAEARAKHNAEKCDHGCRCADGWHIAGYIRQGGGR